MTYSKVASTFRQSQRQCNLVIRIGDVGDSVRPVCGTAYDDAKSSWAPRLSTVRRSAAAPSLVAASLTDGSGIRTFAIMPDRINI